MRTKVKIWLSGIIALTIICFLVVFQPVKIKPRMNIDTKKPIVPVAELGPIKIYRPIPEITLGLDLRGGIHLVLQLRRPAIFEYEFAQPIAATEEAKAEVRSKLSSLLPEEKLPKRSFEVSSDRITIRTEANTKQEMGKQRKFIKSVIEKQFGRPSREKEPELMELKGDTLAQVFSIIETRVNKYGVSEAIIQRQPPDQLIVELPGIKDPEEAMKMIQTTAQLEFRHIPKKYDVVGEHKDSREVVTFFDKEGNEVPQERVLDESPVILTGGDLEPKCYVDYSGQTGEPIVAFSLKPRGSKTFASFTRTHVGEYLAIVLDREVISCPVIKTPITGGSGIIEGGFGGPGGVDRATNLSILLNAGALPVPVEVVENRTVSATLGKDSIVRSLWAGMVGMIAVLIFMVAYYRLPGLLADLALLIYCLIVLAVLWLFHATLTLPGIAGIIISIGMAVDANIIIFERLKEELHAQKTLKSAIEAGFNRAWAAILDSNLCSIITGIVLYWFGTGPIKGFAVTLLIGVTASMFTAVTITRLFMNITANTRAASNLRLFGV